MTKHMFRVFVGAGKMSVGDLEARIDEWVEKNSPWAADPVEHTLTERNTELDGSGDTYRGVDVRFHKDGAKDNILQKLTDKLKDKVAWYRVGYHSCPHDDTTRTETEDHDLEPGGTAEVRATIEDGSVTIGDGGYEEGADYEVGGRTLTIPDVSSLTAGTYAVEYETTACPWDDTEDWAAKDVEIPAGVPAFEVSA